LSAIPILYLDQHLLAAAKPAGLLVHRSREAPDRQVLLQLLRKQTGHYLFPVHRLDRGASGVVLFGLSSDAARELQAEWNEDDTRKDYLLLARGRTPERFESDRGLHNDRGVLQAARTSFERLFVFEFGNGQACSLCRARLHSGRRHQIRRHLAHLGHFVIGDTTYGKGGINRHLRERYDLPRLCLHARRLAFRHPIDKQPTEIQASLSADLGRFLTSLPGGQQLNPGLL
jgi:tRNA pseudouridine65 synthase